MRRVCVGSMAVAVALGAIGCGATSEDAPELVGEAPIGAACAPGSEEAAAVCVSGAACDLGRCVSEEGAACVTDADCGGGDRCLADGTCAATDALCPAPEQYEPLGCIDWDPAACPCYAGEVAMHEKEAGGRLTCAGTVGIFSDRIRLRQVGCHLEAESNELSGEVSGADGLQITIAQLPTPSNCSTAVDTWSESGLGETRPAVRITCSDDCVIWMERFLPLVPEVIVPTGTFTMGTDRSVLPAGVIDEAPAHPVETSCFTMDRFEASRAEYLECLDKGACENPDYANAGVDKLAFFAGENARLPITFVNHRQADQYCKFRDKALPTEAEWEQAARADWIEEGSRPWGDESPTCSRANIAGCGDAPLPPTDGALGPRLEPLADAGSGAIGSEGASIYGVYDLLGNVREWTRDYYVAASYAAFPLDTPTSNPEQSTPVRQAKVRVVRGGSFLTPADDALLRSSARDSLDELQTAADVGLRCVRYGRPASP